MIDRYEALRKAAEEATPGTWAAGSTEISTVEEAVAICRENIEKTRNPTRYFCELYTSEGNGLRIALVGHGPNSIPNVEYLALAQPSTILDLLAERDALAAQVAALKGDAERLDFMIDEHCWIQWTERDGSIRQCQAMAQDEDEIYHVLSGDHRYFKAPREAIDAARKERKA